MVKRFAKEELMYVFHCFHNITLVQLLLKKPLNWKNSRDIRNFIETSKDVKICQKKTRYVYYTVIVVPTNVHTYIFEDCEICRQRVL